MSTITNDVVGDGLKLEYSTDGTTYTAFANIIEFNGHKVEAPVIDTSVLTSAAKQKQGGVPDYGNWTIKVKWTKALVTLVNGWIAAKQSNYFRATLNDGTSPTTGSTDAVQGFIKEFDPIGTVQQNKRIETTLVIEISGADTFTAGT